MYCTYSSMPFSIWSWIAAHISLSEVRARQEQAANRPSHHLPKYSQVLQYIRNWTAEVFIHTNTTTAAEPNKITALSSLLHAGEVNG